MSAAIFSFENAGCHVTVTSEHIPLCSAALQARGGVWARDHGPTARWHNGRKCAVFWRCGSDLFPTLGSDSTVHVRNLNHGSKNPTEILD